MHLSSMAKLNAASERPAVPETPAPVAEDDAPEMDLKATIALSPDALAALLDEVKKAQGQASEAPAPEGRLPPRRR